MYVRTSQKKGFGEDTMAKKEKKQQQRNTKAAFDNAPIKKKLKTSLGLVIGFALVLVIALLGAMKGIESYVEEMYYGPVTNATYVGDIRYALADIPRAVNFARAEGGLGDAEAKAVAAQAQKDVDAAWALMTEAYNVLKDTLITDSSKEKLENIYNNLALMEPNLEVTMTHLKNGRVSRAGTYFDEGVKPQLDQIRAEVETLNDEIYAVSKDYCVKASRIALAMILVGLFFMVLLIALSTAVTKKVTNSIAKPLEEITLAAEKMRQGDMGAYTEIKHQSKDEIGILADSMRGTMMTLEGYINEISDILARMAQGDLTKNFNEITDFLGDFASIKESFVFILKEFNKTLGNINMVSEQVDRGSDEIATAANELAASTEEQASAVEELTATINTVTNMALDNAKGAEMGYNGMMTSVRDAEDKRKQVEELQAEMQRIKDISAEIANIITAIEEIADQTSLLSLNASIEAARAGEAGRGFAVVADQIGKLATDSAQAAVSTKELIEKTVAEIDKGNVITQATAEAFDAIIKEIYGCAQAAKGSKETAESQAEILKQVEEGINEVAAVTQENAASAEESLATSEELAARAAELAEQVNKFKLH